MARFGTETRGTSLARQLICCFFGVANGFGVSSDKHLTGGTSHGSYKPQRKSRPILRPARASQLERNLGTESIGCCARRWQGLPRPCFSGAAMFERKRVRCLMSCLCRMRSEPAQPLRSDTSAPSLRQRLVRRTTIFRIPPNLSPNMKISQILSNKLSGPPDRRVEHHVTPLSPLYLRDLS